MSGSSSPVPIPSFPGENVDLLFVAFSASLITLAIGLCVLLVGLLCLGERLPAEDVLDWFLFFTNCAPRLLGELVDGLRLVLLLSSLEVEGLGDLSLLGVSDLSFLGVTDLSVLVWL